MKSGYRDHVIIMFLAFGFFSIFAYSGFISLPVITELEVNISSDFSATFAGNDKLVALSDINKFQIGLQE